MMLMQISSCCCGVVWRPLKISSWNAQKAIQISERASGLAELQVPRYLYRQMSETIAVTLKVAADSSFALGFSQLAIFAYVDDCTHDEVIFPISHVGCCCDCWWWEHREILTLLILFSLWQNGTEMANDLWCDAACRTQNVSHVVIQFHLIADWNN